MSEFEKMIAGDLYNGNAPELIELRHRARRLMRQFNNETEENLAARLAVLRQLIGTSGDSLYIEPPFYCDYGSNISLGPNFYMNFGGTILDCAHVHIGADVMCGPHVQIYTATHPLNAEERVRGLEFATPIKIGNRVWIGGGAIICPGVTIGDDTTIGAGSVVTRDLPSNVFAAGNPCRVIRELN